MKVLVVYTNTYRLLGPTPLGASLVASRLRRDGHAVCFVDLMHAADPVATAASAAAGFQPDLCCFSIRNRDNQSASSYFDPMPLVAQIVAAVESASPAPSLLGGTAFSTFPAQILEATGADWGLAGDDLEAVARFVRSVGAGAPDLGTPGLVYRAADGGVTENEFRLAGYRDVRFDQWELIDFAAYRKGFWQAGVVTRTGCPEQCLYCDTFHTFGREFQLREPAQVAEELLALKRTGKVRSVYLVDAGFNRPLDHAKAVLAEILRQRAQLGLYATFDPGECDAEFLDLFRRAGGMMLVMFAESLADPVLEALRKPFRADAVRRDAAAIRRAGLDFLFMPTLGSPGETPETVAETLQGAPRLGAAMVEMSIGFRIQPRTALRERAVAEGLIAPDDDCYQPHFYVSPATPREWLEEQVRRYRRRHRLAFLNMARFIARAVVRRPWAWMAHNP